MENDIPRRQRTKNPTARPLRPREKWSDVRLLPRDEARAIEMVRNLEIANAVVGPEGGVHPDHTARMASALDRLKNIDAQDAVESMLATFMIQTQALATKAAWAASLDYDFPHVSSFHVDRYLRLSMAFMKQMEALAKHRNRGTQEFPTEQTIASDTDHAKVDTINAESRRSESGRFYPEPSHPRRP